MSLNRLVNEKLWKKKVSTRNPKETTIAQHTPYITTTSRLTSSSDRSGADLPWSGVLVSECTDNRVPKLTRISQAQRMAGPRHSQVLRKQENRKEDKLLSGVDGESNISNKKKESFCSLKPVIEHAGTYRQTNGCKPINIQVFGCFVSETDSSLYHSGNTLICIFIQ